MASRSTATPTAPNGVPVPPPSGSPHRRTLKELAYEAIYEPTSRAYGVTLKVVLVAILASIVVLALETMHQGLAIFKNIYPIKTR